MIKKIVVLIGLCFLSIYSCQQNKPTDDSKIKPGMIKFSIFYPNGDGKTFDMDYYANKHMPMAAELFDDALVAMSIDKGLANGAPDIPVAYLAVGSFYFESMASFKSSMGAHSETLKADVPNYTNIRPITQISEVQTAE